MSFSAEWLTLREPLDHLARAKPVLKAVKHHFKALSKIYITDIGCGTGSNLRGSYQAFPKHQIWTLVDYDEKLLKAAQQSLIEWGQEAEFKQGVLHLKKGIYTFQIMFLQADLNLELEKILDLKCDLLTAAAFFDLVSPSWISIFVEALAKRNLSFYTCLTYDGIETWSPPSPFDNAALDAFHTHQQTDKGFGKAAGFEANALLMQAFKENGYQTSCDKSPWVIERAKHASMLDMLLEGSAGAITEAGFKDAKAWQEFHKNAKQLIVSHDDLFAKR